MPTEAQLRDTDLRRRIRERIDDGLLPLIVPTEITAGYGHGELCSACDEPVSDTQIEYDVMHAGRTLSLHLGCHVIWQIECQARIKPRRR